MIEEAKRQWAEENKRLLKQFEEEKEELENRIEDLKGNCYQHAYYF